MSEKSITTCDGCSIEIKVEHSFMAPFVVAITHRGTTIIPVTKHACSKDCLAKILSPEAWPNFEFPAKNQTPPSSGGAYR